MKRNEVYGYIRVSDTKQIDGASLSAQQKAIEEYALKNHLNIIKWFEETKTAAKRGRPKFSEMLLLLKSGKASGVIMHKIDRSARNLHDWASVGDLIDNGIQVHFAHESLDMTERGGRLSADIQAVMASDYVRNLKQEIRKGINGRLNNGIYPFAAPIGYINNGKGQLKTIDKTKAPLVKELFKLYLTRRYNLKTLSKKIHKMGLTNLRGNKLGKDGISKVLNNPFYTGLMKVKGKLYQGNHEPIIDLKTFQRVQLILRNRTTNSGLKYYYLFRRLLKCGNCNFSLSGEMQKGMVYYRCHQKNCPTKTIREDHLEKYFLNELQRIQLHDTEYEMLREFLSDDKNNLFQDQKIRLMNIEKLLIQKEKKIEILLDAYLDSKIDDELYEKRRAKLLVEITGLKQEKQDVISNKISKYDELQEFFELCKNPVKYYSQSNPDEKRDFIEIITSNLVVFGKSLEITTFSLFNLIANRANLRLCAHSLDDTRKSSTRNYPKSSTYSNINTSPILHSPISKDVLKNLFEITLNKNNELPTNNTSS